MLVKGVLVYLVVLVLAVNVLGEDYSCEELDYCDQSCEELDGELCDDDDPFCEGIGIIMEDGSLCCTFIGDCYSEEAAESYNEIIVQEDAEVNLVLEEEFDWKVYTVLSLAGLLLLFLLWMFFKKPRKVELEPNSYINR